MMQGAGAHTRKMESKSTMSLWVWRKMTKRQGPVMPVMARAVRRSRDLIGSDCCATTESDRRASDINDDIGPSLAAMQEGEVGAPYR